jgi:hypothetical protein
VFTVKLTHLASKKSNTQNLCISPLNKCTFKRFFGSFVRKREFDWVNEKCSLEFFKNVCIFHGIQLQPYLSYHLYLYTVSRELNFGAPRLLNPGTFTCTDINSHNIIDATQQILQHFYYWIS